MSFPLHPAKHTLKELYGAREIVAYRRQVGRMPSLSAPEGILFCLERGLPWRLRWQIPVRRAGGMNGDLYELKKPKNKIGIMTGFGGGSPMTVELAEEFAAMMSSSLRARISRRVARMPGLSIWKQPIVPPVSTL